MNPSFNNSYVITSDSSNKATITSWDWNENWEQGGQVIWPSLEETQYRCEVCNKPGDILCVLCKEAVIETRKVMVKKWLEDLESFSDTPGPS